MSEQEWRDSLHKDVGAVLAAQNAFKDSLDSFQKQLDGRLRRLAQDSQEGDERVIEEIRSLDKRIGLLESRVQTLEGLPGERAVA